MEALLMGVTKWYKPVNYVAMHSLNTIASVWVTSHLERGRVCLFLLPLSVGLFSNTSSGFLKLQACIQILYVCVDLFIRTSDEAEFAN